MGVPLDVTSDDAMIESNEIPASEGLVRMEDDPTEVEMAETEAATDSGDVEDQMADLDEDDVLLEETEVDVGGDEDERDETFVDVAEVETVDDDDEATVEVEEEEDEEGDKRGIFGSLLSLFRG